MIKTYFSVLISKGILVREDESGTLEDDGFISYTIADGFVLLGKDRNVDDFERINYVQLVHDQRGNFWVAQLEGSPEDPINIPEAGMIEVDIYNRVGLYD